MFSPSETPLVVEVIVIVGPILSKVQTNWVAAVLLLPWESVYTPALTSIVQAPLLEGVNVAVYVVPEPEKELNEPLFVVISVSTKLVVASVDVNVKKWLYHYLYHRY